MRRILLWIWNRGIVGTFLTGLFAILPLVLTVAIMSWAADQLNAILGPNTAVGRSLENLGMQVVGNRTFATVLGWAFVLVGIWALGVLVRSTTRFGLQQWFDRLIRSLPVVKSVYGPISQVVSLLSKKDESQMSGMPVVYCWFGEQEGGGFLGLLASHDTFRFGNEQCKLVYIPTSPVPMSGGLLFVPADKVNIVDMQAEELMQVYFSLGVMASSTVPARYLRKAE